MAALDEGMRREVGGCVVVSEDFLKLLDGDAKKEMTFEFMDATQSEVTLRPPIISDVDRYLQ